MKGEISASCLNESVKGLRESGVLGYGLSTGRVREQTVKEFGEVKAYADVNDNTVVDEDGTFRIANLGDLTIIYWVHYGRKYLKKSMGLHW